MQLSSPQPPQQLPLKRHREVDSEEDDEQAKPAVRKHKALCAGARDLAGRGVTAL